jgi:alkanesulfonate monooxygenase SsuD/methylene tetrahydromethanopterin reductase-like flavin-dependent oxidoreductase (luciferase family)
MTLARPLAVGVTPMENRRDVIMRVATLAEDLGYSGFFLAEGWGYDAGVLLAEIAVRTGRIRLGTGVLNTWGRTAAGIAMLAASLADLSQGRFILGLGAGSPALAEGFHDTSVRQWHAWARSHDTCGGCWTGDASCPRRPPSGRCGWRPRPRSTSRSTSPGSARPPSGSVGSSPTAGSRSCCRRPAWTTASGSWRRAWPADRRELVRRRSADARRRPPARSQPAGARGDAPCPEAGYGPGAGAAGTGRRIDRAGSRSGGGPQVGSARADELRGHRRCDKVDHGALAADEASRGA